MRDLPADQPGACAAAPGWQVVIGSRKSTPSSGSVSGWAVVSDCTVQIVDVLAE